MEIQGDEDSIHSILFSEVEPEETFHQSEFASKLKSDLDSYFQLGHWNFDYQLRPKGTQFQQKVWNELQKIPFGKTISYLEMAKKLGDEKVIRAAASANGKNPISILIPCHRLIGKDGSLTGYAGGSSSKEIFIGIGKRNQNNRIIWLRNLGKHRKRGNN